MEAKTNNETEALCQQVNKMKQLVEQMNVAQQQNQIFKQQYTSPAPFAQHSPQFQQQYMLLHGMSPHNGFQYQDWNNSYLNNHGGRGDCRRGRGGRGGRGGNQHKWNYCWAHGLDSHNGKECNNPMCGYQANATLENRMGGNTKGYSAWRCGIASNIYDDKKYTDTLTVIPPHQNTQILCKEYSGATKTYLESTDLNISRNTVKLENGPTVGIPNGKTMRSIEAGTTALHNLLSLKSKQAKILEGMNNALLLLIRQLCDNDCVVVFNKRYLHVYKQEIIVVKGTCNWYDGLWDVHVNPQQQQANVIIRKEKMKHELAEYLQKCAFSSSLSTFQRAINKRNFSLLAWNWKH